MPLRIILGLALTVAAFWFAGRRLYMLYRLGRTAQPVEQARLHGVGGKLRYEATEVLGQAKLLKWTVPGIAHFVTFWGFLILVLTLIEGYGSLFQRDFHIPWIGTQPWLGFLEDLVAVGVLVAIVVFAAIRLRQAPKREGRRSRFFGSHTGAAWLILFMIFNVVWTLLLYRGAQINTGNFPYERGAFASETVAKVLKPLGRTANDVIETVGVLLALGVVLAFLVIVAYSKHLHIFLAPLNVAFGRRPRALGALVPVISDGKPVNFEDPGEDDKIGRGAVEDFSWKGFLDFGTCTECGRCQSQCPAWNTGKPLSPKLLIMSLRDNALAKAPYLLAGGGKDATGTEKGDPDRLSKVDALALAEAERPLVGGADVNGVIDPDVLWSCTTCGACVEQCPVDIEHVDHIVDMRRYQVLIESNFPSEAGVMLRNLENKGNPWGAPPNTRTDWTRGLDFEVPMAIDGGDFEYLFWVGCAGAFEDRAKKTTRAVATLLHEAGVSFAILGDGETCTGDPARRIGNEFVFQMMAQQNVETLNELFADKPAKKIVATCPHCFNTLANEYGQLGGHFEVVHHTQLLAHLVQAGRLTPVQPVDGGITYHDPCYLGRHNRIFAPPREVLGAVAGAAGAGFPAATPDGAGVPNGAGGATGGAAPAAPNGAGLVEMQRFAERSFCCGAGGARMWMEERIGKRINVERVQEAVATGAGTVAVSCPFCMTMLSDGVTGQKAAGEAPERMEVVDVATVLLRSIKG